MRTTTEKLGRWLATAAVAALILGACGRPAPTDEAQLGAAPDPAAQSATPSSDTVDAAVPPGGDEVVATESVDPAPVLTADNVAGVVDSTPGMAGVKITSQSPIVAPTPTTTPPTVAESTPMGTGGVHVVESGDTLSGIAATYGVSIQAIADANGVVDVDNLKPGQELQIPPAG